MHQPVLILILINVVMKGNSNNLMKATTKRRRTKAQIELDKLKAEQKETDILRQLGELSELKK